MVACWKLPVTSCWYPVCAATAHAMVSCLPVSIQRKEFVCGVNPWRAVRLPNVWHVSAVIAFLNSRGAPVRWGKVTEPPPCSEWHKKGAQRSSALIHHVN